MGCYRPKGGGGQDAMAYGRQWAQRVAEKLTRAMGGDGLERRAVVSGSLDIPQFIEPEVIAMARPQRLIDLFTNRVALDGNSFEYFVQSARTNTATAVADAATKPTSTLTVTPHTDRCRVVAHLSEAAPIRLWFDHDEFVSWLSAEMVGGVLDGLEAQIISGSGSGENMVGLLNTPVSLRFRSLPTSSRRCAVPSPPCRTSANSPPAGRSTRQTLKPSTCSGGARRAGSCRAGTSTIPASGSARPATSSAPTSSAS